VKRSFALMFVLVLVTLACSGRHHGDSNSPIPSVQAATEPDAQICYPWTGHGPVKVIESPFVDTCMVGGVCYYHCGRQ